MVVDAVKNFEVGDGFGKSTTHGPLIHGNAVTKVQEHVEDAVAQGAKILLGGKRLGEAGTNYFPVTVLSNMKPGMRLCREETFSPVAAFFPFTTEEEAIELASDTDMGLAGYFFSKDVNRCW